MKLEISDREIIELFVTFKERLDRIENKIDTIAEYLLGEVEQHGGDTQFIQEDAAGVVQDDMKNNTISEEEQEAITYMATPTLENVCLYNPLPTARLPEPPRLRN